VPPALPATLSIGTSFAIGRLRKLGIYCISPNRVNIAGRINVVCFDKTGTLTEDGLDVLGARCMERSGDVFGELTTNVHDLPPSLPSAGKADFLQALATCHSLKVVNGEILGDPLDARMFEFTGWTIEEGRSGNAARPGSSRPADLVQAVVRPPGSARFRLEDALKIGARVCTLLPRICNTILSPLILARAFSGTGCDQNFRVRVVSATNERHRQETQEHEHGNLC
jgi:cation-transporting ATPase 13A2